MESSSKRFPAALLEERVALRLREAGASEASLAAATRAMLHASLVGVDSHGVRLTEHYCRMLGGGRLNKDPKLRVERRAAGSAMVDGDDGLGHYAAYRALEVGIELAREAGVGAVGVKRSSHLGAAGAYALAGAEQGFVTFATTIPIRSWRCSTGRKSSTAPIHWPSRRRCRATDHGCSTWRPRPSRSTG